MEYLVITPLAIVLLAALLGQLTLAAMGLVACEAAARDAAVAAARGNTPELAARKAAPDWQVKVSRPRRVVQGDYEGVSVTVTLTVPAMPFRMLRGRGVTVSRTATMPVEGG